MMDIRPATLDDVKELHALGESVLEFAVSDGIVNFWPNETLVNAINSDDVVVLVAVEQKIFGFIIASYSKGLKKATIENIFVNKTHRGKGAGNKLLSELLSHLSKRGCEYVATLVPQSANAALETYVNAGFSRGETFIWLDHPLTDKFIRD